MITDATTEALQGELRKAHYDFFQCVEIGISGCWFLEGNIKLILLFLSALADSRSGSLFRQRPQHPKGDPDRLRARRDLSFVRIRHCRAGVTKAL
jgi:hypothetical protein